MYSPNLQSDVVDESILHKNTLIHVCMYQINKESPSYPFLQYFLLKERPENELCFPNFTYDFSLHTDPILEISANIVQIIFEAFSLTENKAIFKGIIQEPDNLYIFFDCTAYSIESHILVESNDIWLALIDEIVNVGSVYEFKIKDVVRNLFLENTSLVFLKNQNGNNEEIPVVAFTSCTKKKVNFITTFRLPATLDPSPTDEVLGHYGPYYYFTNDKDKNITVRFAIFLGNMTITLDDSPNRWLDQKYHSLYLSGGGDTCYWIITDYDRQIPLCAYMKIT
jgi:hypothetical protein